ncbi:MAG: hypothetical protein Q4D89_05710 [Arachnia propionica]|uniref:hypothetical protein n=1 Tax=Arachnia propionica TaxID=1750 RepID=UPI0027106A5D|nr:hypothetical protein [Arachnia propionica]
MTIDIPQIVVKAGNAKALVAQLRSLTDEERAEWASVMRKSLPVWRKAVQWWTLDRDEIPKISDPTRRKLLNQAVDAFDRHHRTSGRLLLVAVALGATPAQLVKLALPEGLTMLEREQATGHLADLMAERGTEWVEETMAGLLAQSSVAMAASSLISHLVIRLDLPVPHVAAHLGVWFGTMPTPGTRWQDHFLAACATPDTFWNRPERDEHIARIREAATELRRTEPTDDTALLDALLSVIERGERPGPQREALAWIEGLDLDPTTQPERMLGALDVANSQVAAAFTRILLGMDPDGDTLTRIALAILPRKEKGLKRDVLKRLASIESPSAELMEHIADLSRSTDTTTATLASTLCESWGSAPAQDSGTRGLWQEPSLPDPEPFPGLETLVLDDPALAALVTEIEDDWAERAEVTERALAQLVATAHARGPEVVVAACRAAAFDPSPILGHLPRLLARLGDGTIVPGTEPAPARSPEGPLVFLAAQRARDVLHRLGEIPSLLSTPSTARHEVTADDFRARLTQYLDADTPLEPTDVAIALTRIRPGADLTGCDAPIRGCEMRLAEVIDLWASTTPEPAEPVLRPTGTRGEEGLHVVGDALGWHEALGLDTVWQHPYPCDTGYRNHHVADLAEVWPGPADDYLHAPAHDVVLRLMPQHLGRPAWRAMLRLRWAEIADSLTGIVSCIEVAPRVTEPVTTAALAVAATVAAKDRDRIAAPLLAAWDEGRLTADDLLAGWHSPAWELVNRARGRNPVDRSPAKITALLAVLAEAGGLALVWPLLVEIAEELAAAEKIPAATSTVLETVLALLPEVPHAIDLPNIAALAARKGSSKAITLARAVTEASAAR